MNCILWWSLAVEPYTFVLASFNFVRRHREDLSVSILFVPQDSTLQDDQIIEEQMWDIKYSKVAQSSTVSDKCIKTDKLKSIVSQHGHILLVSSEVVCWMLRDHF